MYTQVQDKEGIITSYRTQQYVYGTYLIINDDASQQMSLSISEIKLHKKLRNNKNLTVIDQY